MVVVWEMAREVGAASARRGVHGWIYRTRAGRDGVCGMRSNVRVKPSNLIGKANRFPGIDWAYLKVFAC
jgi:hypothetical protein